MTKRETIMYNVLITINYLPGYFLCFALAVNIKIWYVFYVRIGEKSTNPLKYSGMFTEVVDKYLSKEANQLDVKIK